MCVDCQVCEEARCPNIGECWGGGEYSTATATIMVGSTLRVIQLSLLISSFNTPYEGCCVSGNFVKWSVPTSTGWVLSVLRGYIMFVFCFFLAVFISIADGGHMHTWVQVLFCKDGSSACSIGPR